MNFTYEKRFLDFLGYKTKPAAKRNILSILDANDQLVGSVNNYCDGLRYELRIKRNNCRLLMQRSVDPTLYKGLSEGENYDDMTTYQFTISFDKNTCYKVTLDLSNEPFINISTYEGKMLGCLILNKDILTLELLTDTDNYNVRESLTVKVEEDIKYIHKGLAYLYDIAFAPYSESLTFKNYQDTQIYSLKASRIPSSNATLENSVCITTSIWNGQKEESIKEVVPGTISEIVAKNELALFTFDRFHHLISKIVPSEKDVITSLANCKGDLPYPMALFIPTLLPEMDLSMYDSVITVNNKIKLGLNKEMTSQNKKKAHIDIVCSNGNLYDFGSITLIDTDNLDMYSIIEIYQNYLLKYSDGINLARAFDLNTEREITDSEELNKINSQYIGYKKKVLKNSK